jgi:hypothetical protein
MYIYPPLTLNIKENKNKDTNQNSFTYPLPTANRSFSSATFGTSNRPTHRPTDRAKDSNIYDNDYF